MHDTPGKFLFTKAKRAFSHGCIRVDAPLGLAEAVLEGEGWSREQIESQIGSGETKTVILAEPLPVFIFYWTAEVGRYLRARRHGPRISGQIAIGLVRAAPVSNPKSA
jgi:murein L,D-transpeptidase YcbB/YkuD